jgi:hypothetical protein
VHAQSQLADDTKGAASATFQSPKQIGIGAGIGDADLAVGGYDLGFKQARGGHAVVLGEAAETAALNQAGDANRGTAAALNVRSRLGRDGIIGLQPNCSSANRDRALWSLERLATLSNETVMQGDIVHVARPNQEGIGSVRCALITVATAFDDKTQIVLASEIYGGSDIVSTSGGDGINAGFGRPRVYPAQGLG